MINFVSAEAAASQVRSGDVLLLGGNGGMGVAEDVLEAIEARY